MYNCITMLYTRNQSNTANQQYFNKRFYKSMGFWIWLPTDSFFLI